MSPAGSVDGHLLDWRLLGNGKEEPPFLLEEAPRNVCLQRPETEQSHVVGGRWEPGSRTAGPRSSMPRGHRIVPSHPPPRVLLVATEGTPASPDTAVTAWSRGATPAVTAVSIE